MTADIDVHAFYVEKATAASYRVGDSINNIGQLRASLQRQASLKFDREWLQPPDIHPDPSSVLLATNVHGTAILEDNSMTLESVCDSANHILAIIPSRQLDPSNSPSVAAIMTQTLASPAHGKHQELVNLVLSMNNALELKDQMRNEQQADFLEILQTFQRDQLQRDEEAKQQFQRYAKDAERQLKDTQRQLKDCHIPYIRLQIRRSGSQIRSRSVGHIRRPVHRSDPILISFPVHITLTTFHLLSVFLYTGNPVILTSAVLTDPL
ncbi:hypothetical protein F4604DRAFT_1929150 [Suillus subluteus]|nr:hypothetical protein F4604DRAFT_1929150 [Suillus subluteus]